MSPASSAPQPMAQGTLDKTPFAHLLIYIEQHRLTGTLALWPASEHSTERPGRMYFEAGWPTAARVAHEAARLQDALLPWFEREAGIYAFYGENLLGSAPGLLTGKLDPLALCVEAIRRYSMRGPVAATLSRLGNDRLRLRPHVDLERFGWNLREKAVIELLAAEPASVDALASQAPLPDDLARRILYLLVITQAVEPYLPETHGSRRVHRSGTLPVPNATSVPPRAGVATPPYDMPLPPTHDARPPIHATTSPSTDTTATLPGFPAPRPSSVPRIPIATPSDRPISASFRPPRTSQSPRKRRSSLAPHETNPPPPPPEGLSRDLAVRWREITARYKDIDQQNYFDMLGVGSNASTQDIKNAYFQLVKQWHPDRLPDPLVALKPTVEAVFTLLSRAHDTLTDENQRLQYVRAVKNGGGTPASDRLVNAVLEAALQYQKVEVMVRRHRYDEALALLDRVIEINPEEADYYAMRAWLFYQSDLAGEQPLIEMLEATQHALALNEAHDRAHYIRGLALKRMGRPNEALKHFKRTVELNPRHTDAQRELRIAAMRQEQKTPPERPAPGLLSRLFKK